MGEPGERGEDGMFVRVSGELRDLAGDVGSSGPNGSAGPKGFKGPEGDRGEKGC